MTILGTVAGAYAAGLALLAVAGAVTGRDAAKNLPLMTLGASAASCKCCFVHTLVIQNQLDSCGVKKKKELETFLMGCGL